MIKNLPKKIIFLILSFLIMLFVPATTFAAGATLTLDPSSGTISKGCTFNVAVKIDTAGVETDGADAIINYDASVLSTSNNNITSGTVYQSYSNGVDEQTGKIEIHGIADVDKPFSGTGTLATIKFSVKSDAPSSGTTPVRLEFNELDKSDTIESNIVQRGTITDILFQVNNSSFTLSATGCSVGTGGSSSPSGTGNTTNRTGNTTTGQGATSLTGSKGGLSSSESGGLSNIDDIVGGKTGLFDNTLVVASAGIFLVILGLIGFALL